MCASICVYSIERKLGGHTAELAHVPLNCPLGLCTVLANKAIACRVPEWKLWLSRCYWTGEESDGEGRREKETHRNQCCHLYPLFIHSLALFWLLHKVLLSYKLFVTTSIVLSAFGFDLGVFCLISCFQKHKTTSLESKGQQMIGRLDLFCYFWIVYPDDDVRASPPFDCNHRKSHCWSSHGWTKDFKVTI